MKLPIKKKYFNEIKAGTKRKEYRDAHITFICEETGEPLRLDVEESYVINKEQVHPKFYKEVGFTDDKILVFVLSQSTESTNKQGGK